VAVVSSGVLVVTRIWCVRAKSAQSAGSGIRYAAQDRPSVGKWGKMMLDDFRYDVQIDYDTHYSCETSGCNEEGICRCGSISNVRVTGVACEDVAAKLCASWGVKGPLALYCMDRIVRSLSLYKNENWQAQIGGDYYGDEVNAITLTSQAEGRIADVVAALREAKNKIEFVLTREYGFVSDNLKGKKWSIESVSLKDVDAGSDGQMRKVDRDGVDCYITPNYVRQNLPIGIVLPNSAGGFRLVDGYHRLVAAREAGKKKVNIVVGR